MPSTLDWINNPLGVVEGLFAVSQNNPDSGWEQKVIEFFKDWLKEKDAHTLVPSLNDVPLHYLKPNSLVKFRCFIQDMFDPEFYMGAYETVDPSTQARTLRCGKYKDVTECGVDFSSSNAVTSERQTFYCVPIPGENPWVKEKYAGDSQARVVASTSYVPSRQKRSHEDDEDDDMDMQPQKQREPHAAAAVTEQGPGDGRCQEAAAPPGLDLNFPLPGERGPACLVKVYENWDGFKLNETLEVFGILSVSPALSVLADEKDASSALLDPMEGVESAEEQRAHCPPASLVPRLHMLHARRPPPHHDPLLLYCAPPAPDEAARAELLEYFTHLLLGDALAAQYLLLHLVSSVYSRRDVLPLGKFCLNLSGCPPGSAFTERLYQAVQQLVPASFYLGLSLQNMNQMRLVPRKDYGANRLVSGALQLSANTWLFLDETKMEQGQLDAAGVRNVTALGNVISWQKVDYDFSFHQMEFPCNLTVLVASEGRSLLPSDSQIHLHPLVAPSQLDQHRLPPLPSPQLDRFRAYLSAARLLDYSISDEVTKSVEDDFVDMRKDDPRSVSAEDLHRMLVVARLLSLSLGRSALSADGWTRAKQLEAQRRSRMEQHKCVNGNEP